MTDDYLLLICNSLNYILYNIPGYYYRNNNNNNNNNNNMQDILH
jgi:hypothetical protein